MTSTEAPIRILGEETCEKKIKAPNYVPRSLTEGCSLKAKGDHSKGLRFLLKLLKRREEKIGLLWVFKKP